MKRFAKSMLGVTLLEIMLVLAIAAMIVVMSIRYYQAASASQQANAAIGQIQSIMAAVDNLGMNGGYNGVNVTTSNITAIVGSNNMITPTGGTITYTANSATTYTLSVPLNVGVCALVEAKMTGNTKITTPACNNGTFSFTYNAAL